MQSIDDAQTRALLMNLLDLVKPDVHHINHVGVSNGPPPNMMQQQQLQQGGMNDQPCRPAAGYHSQFQ